MQIKNFLLLACFSATAPLIANNTPIITSFLSNPEKEHSCNAPAPGNFHVASIGTQSVDLAWDFQTEAVDGYRIRTYKNSNNALVSTLLIPQDETVATVSGLDMGEEYYSVINSICAGGENSSFTYTTPPFKALILELIVNGYQSNDLNAVCTLVTPGICSFYGTQNAPSAFRISKGAENRRFGMSIIGSSDFQCTLEFDNSSSNFKFYCTWDKIPDCQGGEIVIKHLIGGIEHLVAVFSAGNVLGDTRLKCTFLDSGYVIQRLYGYVGTNPGGRQSDDYNSGFAADQWVSASPNPFTETLDVILARSAAGEIQLRLFNLNGQEVLKRQFKAGQESFSFSTAHLSPGFYLLRVEANGAVQTLKVIKSE